MNAWGFRPLFAIAALTALAALLTGMGIRSRNYAVSDAPLRIRELFEPMSLPPPSPQFFFMMAYGVVEVYVAIYARLLPLAPEAESTLSSCTGYRSHAYSAGACR